MEVLNVRKWILILCCICFLCINVRVNAQEIQGSLEESKELIVLVDTSGTMNGRKWKREIEWVQQICAAGKGTGINISFVCFDDSIKQEINGSDEQQSMEELESLSATGKKTNLCFAMDWAVSRMNNSDAEYKCIVMLSDAQLDLVGRLEETYDLEDKEIESMDDFKSLVKKFNGDDSDRQSVILVEFDEENKGMCIDGKPEYIFQDLKEDGITCFSWLEEADKAIDDIFDTLDYPSTATERKESENNEILFSVEENCYRVIVNIYNKDVMPDVSQMESLKIDFKDPETGRTYLVSANDMLTSTWAAYLYLEKPKCGDYTISLPDGRWESSVRYQKAVKIDGVETVVVENDIKLRGLEGTAEAQQTQHNIYKITNAAFQLGYHLDIASNENDDGDNSNISVEYYMKSVAQIDDSLLNEDNQDKKFMKASTSEKRLGDYELIEVKQRVNGLYKCEMRVYSGGIYYYGEPFWLQVEIKDGNSYDEEKTVKVEENIELRSLVSEYNTDETVWVIVNSEQGTLLGDFIIDEPCERKQFVAKDGSLTFLQVGEYIVDIARGGIDGIESTWCIIVEDEAIISRNWLEELLEFLRDLFSKNEE